MHDAQIISEMDGDFTLVGAVSISTISQFDGSFGGLNVEAVSIMWSHMGGGTTVKYPVMVKNGLRGSRSKQSTIG